MLCIRCKIDKNISEFRIDKRYNKPRSFCKECDKAYLKEYYLKHRPPLKVKIESPEGFKFCKKCNQHKVLNQFYKHGGHTCKECHNNATKKRYVDNPEIEKKRRKDYRNRSKDKIREKAAIHRKKTNHSQYSAKRAIVYRAKVSDSYVRALLKKKGINYITPEAIEVERGNILLKRLRRKLEKKGVKVCSICKGKKNISEFYIRQWKWKGIKKHSPDNICKSCSNKRSKKYR